jgi:hypothetical protein
MQYGHEVGVQYRELLQLVMHILNKPTSEVSILSLSVQPSCLSLFLLQFLLLSILVKGPKLELFVS